MTDPMKNKWCFSGFGKESGQILDRLLRNCIGGADAVLVLLNVAELGYYLGVDYHGGRSRERRYSNNIQKSIAEDIHKALTENYHMHWKAAMFAEKYGLSDTTVKSYFRNIYGYSFKAYQMKLRLQKSHRRSKIPSPLSPKRWNLCVKRLSLSAGYRYQLSHPAYKNRQAQYYRLC